MIDKTTSDNIRLTVILATCVVVIRHSFNAHVYWPNIREVGPSDVNSFVQVLNSHTTASAVPVFFLLSAYLFFYGFQLRRDLLRKYRSRLYSLVVPYSLWNVLYLVVFLMVPHIAYIQTLSAYAPLTLDWHTVLARMTSDPAAGQLWFVRDLMCFVAVAPLFACAFQHRWLACIILLGCLVYWQPVDCSWLSSEGLLFYFAGGWAGYEQLNLGSFRLKSRWVAGVIVVVWLGLCLYQTIWLRQGVYSELAAKTSTVGGVVILFLLAERIRLSSLHSKLLLLAPYVFFIYALHTPMCKGIYKALLSVGPRNAYFGFLVYIAVPVITIVICVAAATLIRRCNGTTYSLLTGGR
jgi:hypothetical protein